MILMIDDHKCRLLTLHPRAKLPVASGDAATVPQRGVPREQSSVAPPLRYSVAHFPLLMSATEYLTYLPSQASQHKGNGAPADP